MNTSEPGIKERYDNLDGLRVISCLCIIAMHIMKNANYNLGTAGERIIASWTHFVPLFLMISGFGMFCGYYERFRSGNADLNSFYSKRYKKFLPFFATLIVLDIVLDRSLVHVIEGITEATMVFGLLPNNELDVIGVSWTLGVIFLFYMLFPFAVFLCWNRKRAWFSFAASIMISLFCSMYFFSNKFVLAGFAPRHSILYCAPWLFTGGLIYLYRQSIGRIVSKYRWIWLCICSGLTAVWYFVPSEIKTVDIIMLKNLILFALWLMYAISVKSDALSNKVMKYLSGISLELYLAQMVIFRVIEKLHLLYIFDNGWVSFVFAWIMELVGLVVFIELWKRVYKVCVFLRNS